MTVPRVYLAGPDVFLANALELGALKKQLCRDSGLEALFPLDLASHTEGMRPSDVALALFNSCVTLMNQCDAAIANMTPFRGPSMDVGTAVEIGYMFAQGKPIFGYSSDERTYRERVQVDGFQIEDFDQADNLMCSGVVRSSGHEVVRCSSAEPLVSLEAFKACVSAAAAALRVPGR